MSVVFSTHIAWGLRIDEQELEQLHPEHDPVDIIERLQLPDGWDLLHGGDLMDGVNIAYVVGPRASVVELYNSQYFDGNLFGVHKLEDFFTPDDVDFCKAIEVAGSENLMPHIGHWVVSSVG